MHFSLSQSPRFHPFSHLLLKSLNDCLLFDIASFVAASDATSGTYSTGDLPGAAGTVTPRTAQRDVLGDGLLDEGDRSA